MFAVNWEAHVGNGLIPQAPKIDWKITTNIALERGRLPQAFVSGQRDLFPAYEIYVNQAKIYRGAPPGMGGKRLPVQRIGYRALFLLGRHLFTIPNRGYSPVG